ncbi:DNA replication protein psf1 [Coemansia sp. RSA 2706]|nr:DNA replication protein psf1 [Coemansia sp. RSA 2711]KAJ2300387.1 DNA replication protein psf1 [Coemansia sp. RSA 2706]KAJ2318189.1 DNA replication protein psf1 [Coemansia sp. RSA 2704]KAJ2737665.1 DNA replication protein psf1 [Coemansia sp. Cherry 401B]
MLGDEAFRLAKEAKDITDSHIPVYNEEQVRLVTQETRYLWTRIEEMIASLSTGTSQNPLQDMGLGQQPSDSQSQMHSQGQLQSGSSAKASDTGKLAASSSLGATQTERENTNGQTSLYILTVGRNKRCLLAYHHRRMQYVRSLLWSLHLAPSLVPAETSARLAPEEQNFAREYARLNSAYRDAVEEQLCPTDSLDWTANGELPPRDIFIEVRVVKDCGEIVTESGVVNLQAGTQHYLRRSDIEHLVTIGYLEHIHPT